MFHSMPIFALFLTVFEGVNLFLSLSLFKPLFLRTAWIIYGLMTCVQSK